MSRFPQTVCVFSEKKTRQTQGEVESQVLLQMVTTKIKKNDTRVSKVLYSKHPMVCRYYVYDYDYHCYVYRDL